MQNVIILNILFTEYSYFTATNDGDIVTISIKEPIPEEVLATNDHFLFTLLAAKENTEGASAAIYISVPKGNSRTRV